MRLIEKRVGLLFAAFALAFCVVMVRAAWLQTVKGGEYSADARSQQVATVEVPGIRGAILDRRGNALAVSEEAATIFATPYQVKDPPKAAKQLAEVLGEPEDDILEALTAQSGFEYVAQKVDLVTADRVEKLGARRDRDPARLAPRLSAGDGRRAADRRGRRRRAGPVRHRAVRGRRPRGHRRRGRDHQGRARPGDQPRRRHRRRRRPRRPAHDRRPDPVLHREGPRRHRREVHARGRDRDRHGPDRRRRARDGELAAGRSERPLRCRPRSAHEHGDRLHLRAGLDLQGVHRRRRARRRARQARDDASTCRPRSRSPTGRSASRTRSATGR